MSFLKKKYSRHSPLALHISNPSSPIAHYHAPSPLYHCLYYSHLPYPPQLHLEPRRLQPHQHACILAPDDPNELKGCMQKRKLEGVEGREQIKMEFESPSLRMKHHENTVLKMEESSKKTFVVEMQETLALKRALEPLNRTVEMVES